MPQIKPITDLRNTNDTPDECHTVKEPVFITEKYTQFADDVESILDEADRAARDTDVRYTHDEVFSRVRRSIGGR